MAGHSKWANIRHRKGAADAKRNRIFTKLMREITIAAKTGGDIDANPRLRSVVLKARVENMPKDNIEKAIKKGLGETDGANYEEIVYEAYIGRVALMINVLTDNKNRSASDVRTVLKKGASVDFAVTGSVSRLFERKGQIFLPSEIGEDLVMEVALEAGAEDIVVDEDVIQVMTDPRDFSAVLESLQNKEWEILKAGVEFIPMTTETLDAEQAQKFLNIVDKLEDLDDVQSVEHNLEIPEELED